MSPARIFLLLFAAISAPCSLSLASDPAEIDQLKSEYREVQNRHVILLAEKAQLVNKIKELEESFAEMQQRLEIDNDALTRQLKMASDEKIMLISDADRLNSQLRVALKEKREAQAALATQERTLESLNIAQKRLEWQLGDLKTEKKKLEHERQEFETQLAEVQQKLTAQQKAVQSSDRKLLQNKTDLAAASNRAKSSDTQLQKLISEKASLTKQRETLAAAKTDFMARVARLDQELRQAQEENKAAKDGALAKAETAKVRLQTLEAEKLALAQQLERLSAKNDRLSVQVDNLNQQLKSADKLQLSAATDLQQQLGAKEMALARLEGAWQSLTNQYNALSAENKALKMEQQGLNVQLANLQQRHAEQTDIPRLSTVSRQPEPAVSDAPTAEKLAENNPQKTTKPEKPSGLEVIESVLNNWRKAWSAQNVEDYLSYYSADFTPNGSLSRSAWMKQRRVRLKRPKFINVSLTDIAVQLVDARSTRINFIQSYRSNTYRDRVKKQLEMQKEQGKWKIISEIDLKTLTAQSD